MCVCDKGRGKDHVTSHFKFFHNFMFYLIMHNTNLSRNYHLRSCKKLKGISGFVRNTHWGRGSKIIKNSKTYFMDGPLGGFAENQFKRSVCFA